MVAIFPNVCLWRRSLCLNLAGIDPEKLYRATFICQYGLCCCIIWPSFLFDRFVKNWATCKNFLGKWFTAPPGKKMPVRLCLCKCFQLLQRRFFLFFSLADYEAVVKLSDGFNGADLRNVCTEAGLCGIIPIALKFSPTSIVSSKTVLHLKK